MHKLTAIQRQTERMQTKDDQKQQKLHKKPETRACFRCGKIGHVAKFCSNVIDTAHKHIRKCLTHFNMIPGIIGHHQFYNQENLSLYKNNLIKTRIALLQPPLRDQVFHQELNQHKGIFVKTLFTVSKLSSLLDRKLHETDNKILQKRTTP